MIERKYGASVALMHRERFTLVNQAFKIDAFSVIFYVVKRVM